MMTVNPSDYDLIQDGRLDDLESLIEAENRPPAGTEYSYPIANQGITQEQFRTMMRAAGSGTFVQHDDTGAQVSYRLSGHGTDSETNQRNTLILKPATTTGRAETVYQGFFHVLTEAMEIPFPAVTSGTTYHVCVTYDPRLFKTTPLKIEVYPGTPPTTNGRDSIVLFKVRREPNQLLSQATITQVNPWLGHVINVWSHEHLPEPTSVEYGTLAVVINPSRAHVPHVYTNRGVHGWVNTTYGQWENITEIRNTWRPTSGFPQRARLTPTGVQVDCTVSPDGGGTLSEIGMELFKLPSYVRPPAGTNTTNALLLGVSQTQTAPVVFRLSADGSVTNLKPYTSNLGWVRFYGEVFYG